MPYALVNIRNTMQNHNVWWVNQAFFLWPLWIAHCELTSAMVLSKRVALQHVCRRLSDKILTISGNVEQKEAPWFGPKSCPKSWEIYMLHIVGWFYHVFFWHDYHDDLNCFLAPCKNKKSIHVGWSHVKYLEYSQIQDKFSQMNGIIIHEWTNQYFMEDTVGSTVQVAICWTLLFYSVAESNPFWCEEARWVNSYLQWNC